MRNRKLLFYSHDTFGLGHIRRTQKIANSVAAEDRSILIACASPKASSFASNPGIEYLNLPGFTKQMTGDYVPRSLNIPTDEFVNLRSHLLLSTVRSFSPDLFIIDKEPLGVKKELLPSLEYLRQYRKEAHVVCGFRDILDDKATVMKEWQRRDTVRALNDYFHTILVYGEPEIFDFAKEYDLPDSVASKIVYTGYIQPKETHETDDVEFRFEDPDRPLVTFTLGGGGDGWNLLECYIQAIEESTTPLSFNTVILTGPFASPALISKAKQLAEKNSAVQAASFTANTAGLFAKSQLVLSMGGYNTFCELVSARKYPLILPRIQPRQEQLIRAEAFKQRGFCDYLHPDQVTPRSLLAKIEAMLKNPQRDVPQFPTRGLDEIKKFIERRLSQ